MLPEQTGECESVSMGNVERPDETREDCFDGAGACFFSNVEDELPSSLVWDAMRCWRTALDDGAGVQPRLYRALASYECEMLAPVFDSLMNICEWASERPIVVGRGRPPSADERLLLDLLIEPKLAEKRLPCANEVAHVLRCALHSMRIMLKLTLTKGR